MSQSADHREPSDAGERLRARDLWVAGSAGLFAAFMVGMAYAAVPLYDWFCRTTGFGGTTQVATALPSEVSDRMVTVRFDANVGPGLPWGFAPERTAMQVRLGDVITVDYNVVNRSARETYGMASYNVTPLNIGAFFHKVNCFCFTDQTLAPGEQRQMTVVFYVDPALAKDADGRNIDTITLSYSFFPQRQASQTPGTSQTFGASQTIGASQTTRASQAQRQASQIDAGPAGGRI